MEYWRCGLTRQDRVSNEKIRRKTKREKDVFTYVEEKRLLWYGHVRRAADHRWIKKIMEWSTARKRRYGRPRKSWRDAVNINMKKEALKIKTGQTGQG